MEQVPDIISTKDLAYLCDIFSWNYNALKLSNHFKMETENNELKDVFNDIYDIHKEICEDILKIMEGKYE